MANPPAITGAVETTTSAETMPAPPRSNAIHTSATHVIAPPIADSVEPPQSTEKGRFRSSLR